MGIIKKIVQPVKNNIKGMIGERKVNSKLNPLIFGKVEHKQINNLILVDELGKSHQIDHIEIRENGIFCIETKNYKGWIFGSEKQDMWTQSLYNGEKHQFINPLKQNKSHIYHINKVLEGKFKINSVVVMVENNADKIECSNVVNLDDLKSYLKKFDDGTRLTTEQMNQIYDTLINAGADISNREHVKNIHKTQSDLKDGICPRCNSPLIERKGKYGTFIGCSNYPECRFCLKEK